MPARNSLLTPRPLRSKLNAARVAHSRRTNRTCSEHHQRVKSRDSSRGSQAGRHRAVCAGRHPASRHRKSGVLENPRLVQSIQPAHGSLRLLHTRRSGFAHSRMSASSALPRSQDRRSAGIPAAAYPSPKSQSRHHHDAWPRETDESAPAGRESSASRNYRRARTGSSA